MKKTELYWSIEGIRPDRSMKNRIMNAAEANDKITVHKRPVFLPAAAALLLIVNIGLIAVYGMGDAFESRWGGGDNSGTETVENTDFSAYADSVYQEITEHDYVKVEFTQTGDYTPSMDYAWYDIYSVETLERGTLETDGGYKAYARYIQREEGYYTNHEYIIAYDGEGYGRNNITSITESDVDYDHESVIDRIDKMHEEWTSDGMELLSQSEMKQYAFDYVSEAAADLGTEMYYINDTYDLQIFKFLTCGYEGTEELWFRYPVKLSGGEYENLYPLVTENRGLECLTSYPGSGYWKDTVSSSGLNYKVVTLPNLVNVNADNAVNYLEKMGFTDITIKEVEGSSVIDNVVIGYNFGAEAGDAVRTDENIELIVNRVYDDSCLADELLWTEMELEFIDYIAVPDTDYRGYNDNVNYPGVDFTGIENEDTGKVFVNSIYTESDKYNVVPYIHVGMTLDDIGNILETNGYYSDRNATELKHTEAEDNNNYNYEFQYSLSDGSGYYVKVQTDGGKVLGITVTKGVFDENLYAQQYEEAEQIQRENEINNAEMETIESMIEEAEREEQMQKAAEMEQEMAEKEQDRENLNSKLEETERNNQE